ncbi:2273_t:CDS:2 [Funneliformis caledonium]|uniref:2273_t:CDS:1 n=1 Tax=Funneliformis caledonium TaxID=1117310 RepID=A0A9N8YSR2_9GLOM|nr:2273_t:CDS:2 [Funneliformis caledonium]
MAAVCALNNGQITAHQINAPDGIVVPVLPAGATGMKISFMLGCAVDPVTANNISNGATNNNNQIVLPDINISQELYLWRTTYTTENTIEIGNCEKRMQFLRGLNPENKLEVKRLGLNKALNNDLIENLEEIEKEKSEMLLGENIYNQPIAQKALINQGIITADVEKIINA